MRNSVVHLCTFTSADELRGRKRTYRNIKAAVLAAGRFSVFEAMDNLRDARMFGRLVKDPEIETFEMGFPWTGVRRRLVVGERKPATAGHSVECGCTRCHYARKHPQLRTTPPTTTPEREQGEGET